MIRISSLLQSSKHQGSETLYDSILNLSRKIDLLPLSCKLEDVIELAKLRLTVLPDLTNSSHRSGRPGITWESRSYDDFPPRPDHFNSDGYVPKLDVGLPRRVTSPTRPHLRVDIPGPRLSNGVSK